MGKKKEQRVKLFFYSILQESGLAQSQFWAPAQVGFPRAWQGQRTPVCAQYAFIPPRSSAEPGIRGPGAASKS